MFKHMDEDESGRISYTEFAVGLRSVLRLAKVDMPDSRLQVWRCGEATCYPCSCTYPWS